jgi:diaminopimelate decarboxylase
VRINVDSLQMLEYMGVNHPRLPLCLRINPHLMAGGNQKISVGHIDSKFGISIHQIPLARRLVRNFGIPVEGLHVHTGSDILDPDIFLRASDLIFAEAQNFDELEYIDFGSGFKVKYHENDLSTDVEDFGRRFSAKFNAFCADYGSPLALKFEPGKYLVSESGSFLARVNLIKQTTACTFIGLDTGFNHFIRPMFYDAYHRIENLSNPAGDKKLYTVVGYLCETDTFGSDRVISEVRKGDVVRFANAGAYCYAMASNYNYRFRPPEILIHEGRDYLISRRETMEDLLRTQPDPAIE